MSDTIAAPLRRAATTTRVRYPETDRMGVAHHSHYFVWFELGRTELMREAGCAYGELEDREDVFFPVVEASAVFKASALYDESLRIDTRLIAAEGVRVRFEYEVRRESDDRLLATGRTVHACCGRDGRPARIPAAIRDRLSGREGAR